MADPIFDYATPESFKRSRSSSKVAVLRTLAVLFVLVLLAVIVLPSGGRPREAAQRVKCASNLRQIGQGILLYAQANGGRFPETLDVLIANQSMEPRVFLCPNSNLTPAIGTTDAEIAANFGKGKHTTYIYVGRGLNTFTPPDTVVAYELMTNEHKDGSNFLFADGHVDFLTKNDPIWATVPYR